LHFYLWRCNVRVLNCFLLHSFNALLLTACIQCCPLSKVLHSPPSRILFPLGLPHALPRTSSKSTPNRWEPSSRRWPSKSPPPPFFLARRHSGLGYTKYTFLQKIGVRIYIWYNPTRYTLNFLSRQLGVPSKCLAIGEAPARRSQQGYRSQRGCGRILGHAYGQFFSCCCSAGTKWLPGGYSCDIEQRRALGL
jgi:hypothetical protein